MKCTNWRLVLNTVVKNGTAAKAPNVPGEIVSVDTNMPTNFTVYYWRLPRHGMDTFKPNSGAEQDMKKLKIYNNKGYVYRSIYCPQHRMNAVDASYDQLYDAYQDKISHFLTHYNQEAVVKPNESEPTFGEVPTLLTYFMLDDPTANQVYTDMTKTKNELETEISAGLLCDTIITTKWKLTEPKYTSTS